ncbi:hypothetical protein AAF712_015581, partial [Marasmius tenuissimus]
YIDHIGFNLKGTFSNIPTPPAYLFVPRLHTRLINSQYCVCHPLPQTLFYWAHDLQGRNVIAEEDWKKCGIPELRVKEWIGTFWDNEDWMFIREYLYSRNYDMDGRQYARDHEYPELIFTNPHVAARVEGLEDSDSDADLEDSDTDPESSSSCLQPASPSSSLLVGALTEDTPTLSN